MATIEERVAAGAAWLDEHKPGWVDRVDLAELDLSDCEACMLSQVYQQVYGYARASNGISYEDAVSLGFNVVGVTVSLDHPEYDDLTQAWRTLIERRRAGGGS